MENDLYEGNFNNEIEEKEDDFDIIFTSKNILLQIKGIFIISIIIFNVLYKTEEKLSFLKPFEKYVYQCKHSKKLNREKIFSEHPYISVCLSALNMQLYIEQNLLSIINQSFQDFEIIVVNDFSSDTTEQIILKLQSEDKRIKLINHYQNLGVYHSSKLQRRIYFINGSR